MAERKLLEHVGRQVRGEYGHRRKAGIDLLRLGEPSTRNHENSSSLSQGPQGPLS